MGEGRPALLSQGFLAALVAAFLIVGACIFTAPAMRGSLPGLILQRPSPRLPLSVPWEPILTREELLRGLSYYGSGKRLHRVAAKLLAGQPIKVYLLGGSVTAEGGSSDSSLSYAGRFFQFINASFPHRDHVFGNKGIPAATSFLYAPCLSYHVPEGADLVVLEFTINDLADGPMTSTARRSYESVIRQLLEYPGKPAILELHHWGWWNTLSPAIRVDRGLFYHPPAEAQFTLFANYYDLTSVSVRTAVWHLMNLGIGRFKVDGVTFPDVAHIYFHPNGSAFRGTIPHDPTGYYVDFLHPNDTGHGVMAELLAYPLMRAVQEVQNGEALSAADQRGDPRLLALPPPMIPHSHDERPSLCAMQADFKPMVVATEGWEYLPERPNATGFTDQKWGWRGTQPGQWAEIVLDTRSSTYKGDALVWLSHLRSYEGMGTAVVECKDGCTCTPYELDGTWNERVSVFWMAKFLVSQHQHCRLRVTVSDQPGEHPDPQRRHKVTLVAVMVTHVESIDPQTSGTLGNVGVLGLDTEPL